MATANDVVWNQDRLLYDILPFLFENEQGEAVRVNGDRYRAMLN